MVQMSVPVQYVVKADSLAAAEGRLTALNLTVTAKLQAHSHVLRIGFSILKRSSGYAVFH